MTRIATTRIIVNLQLHIFLSTYAEIKSRLAMSKSLLEKSLKSGFVECRKVVCLLVGVAGAGKTHTKHLLFRWAPPGSRNSTPIAERPVRAVRVSANGEHLQEVNIDQLDQLVASRIAGGARLDKRTSLWYRIFCCNCAEEITSKKINPPSNHLTSYGTFTCPTDISSSQNENCSCCSKFFDHNTELQEITRTSLDKTAREISVSSGSQDSLNNDWIYLIDSGGQIEFLEALPAFLQHTSVCLFVTKLSEMLSERPKIEYFEDGNLVSAVVCPLTHQEMLLRCVQRIQTQCTMLQDGSTNQASKAVIIGTHQDLERQCLESREEKNEKLRRLLCPKFDQSLVFRGQKMEDLVFPINAKTPGDQDRAVASEIMQVISSAISSLQPQKIPISWFKFEQHIQKLARDHDRKILHRKECLQVAQFFHLSETVLDTALVHLAKFGVIHYYWHLLPNVVFVDPQFLLDKISELVRYHYQLRLKPDPNTATGGELRKFRNEGCITLGLLRKFQDHYTNFFKENDFLKLMNDRLIVTRLIGKEEYFMPCLLQTMEPEEVDRHRVTASGVAPLAIHFSCGWVPHGVFCSLVAFLRSSENTSLWRLCVCPSNPTEPQCLTRNCIKFQLPEDAPGSLTLIDAFSHFEVHVKAQHDVCVCLCRSIRDTLFEGIQKAAETLKYSNLIPKQAFLCKHENTQPHLAIPADAVGYWKCELNPDTSGPLTNQHKMWKGNNLKYA